MDISLLSKEAIIEVFKKGINKYLTDILEVTPTPLTPTSIYRILRQSSGLTGIEFDTVLGQGVKTTIRLEGKLITFSLKRQGKICEYLDISTNIFQLVNPDELLKVLTDWAYVDLDQTTDEVVPNTQDLIEEFVQLYSFTEEVGIIKTLEFFKHKYPYLTPHDILAFKTILEVMSLR